MGGWTEEEEKVFADIQAVSRLTRIQSIQFWIRFKKDTPLAIEKAKLYYPPYSEDQKERFAKLGARLADWNRQRGANSN